MWSGAEMSSHDEKDIETLQDRVNAALSTAFSADGGGLVTRWVVAVETFDENGKNCTYLAAPEMQTWEIVGMAEMTSELARTTFGANVINSMYEDDEDEDE